SDQNIKQKQVYVIRIYTHIGKNKFYFYYLRNFKFFKINS
ncbi:unnamed protein product, partial [marine sediment metagenome]